MQEYQKPSGQVLEELKSTPEGLSGAEAGSRLQEHGPNKLAEGKKVSLAARFFAQLADPMTIILLAAAVVSGVTAAASGESFADVFIILAVVIINAVLGVYQERKAEKAIEALQEMAAATSKVPVSYTHLDVYKRQSLYSGTGLALDPLAFPAYLLGWILPSVLVSTGVGMCLTCLLYTSVLRYRSWCREFSCTSIWQLPAGKPEQSLSQLLPVFGGIEIVAAVPENPDGGPGVAPEGLRGPAADEFILSRLENQHGYGKALRQGAAPASRREKLQIAGNEACAGRKSEIPDAARIPGGGGQGVLGAGPAKGGA